jgi:hypothetical protein
MAPAIKIVQPISPKAFRNVRAEISRCPMRGVPLSWLVDDDAGLVGPLSEVPPAGAVGLMMPLCGLTVGNFCAPFRMHTSRLVFNHLVGRLFHNVAESGVMPFPHRLFAPRREHTGAFQLPTQPFGFPQRWIVLSTC